MVPEERHWKLGDEADLDRLIRRGRADDRRGKRKAPEKRCQSHVVSSLAFNQVASERSDALFAAFRSGEIPQASAPTIRATASFWLHAIGLNSPTLRP